MITPSYLKKGDTVGIVALASKVNMDDIMPAIEIMQNEWGLNVIVGESVNSIYFNFAGTDEIRANDFQKMLDNQEVKAVFSARGGYGSSRIIDKIDFEGFKRNPKWIIGFSDITAVHNHLQQMGYESLHAPMPKTFMKDKMSCDTLYNIIFGKEIEYTIPNNPINRKGKREGQIVGGNLCILAHLIGSISDVNTDGKILFIEDIGEYIYNIDRMLIQLKRAGKLANLAGLVVGTFTDTKENDEPFGKTIYEIIAEHTAEYNYPVCYGFPVGHESMNWTIICGRESVLEITNQEVKLSFKNNYIG